MIDSLLNGLTNRDRHLPNHTTDPYQSSFWLGYADGIPCGWIKTVD